MDRDTFARIAGTYDIARTLITAGADTRWKRRLGACLDWCDRHLDVGCGSGAFLETVRGRHCRMSVGVDKEMSMALRAKRRSNASLIVVADATSLPFKPNTFDAVTATYLLRYVDVHELFANIASVLRREGAVFCSDVVLPQNHFMRAIVRAYLFVGGSLLGLLLHGSTGRFRHLWATVAAFDVESVPDVIRSCDMTSVVEQRHAMGALRSFVARRRR